MQPWFALMGSVQGTCSMRARRMRRQVCFTRPARSSPISLAALALRMRTSRGSLQHADLSSWNPVGSALGQGNEGFTTNSPRVGLEGWSREASHAGFQAE